MNKEISKEEFEKELDQRYNKCFICKERFIESSHGDTVISLFKRTIDKSSYVSYPRDILFLDEILYTKNDNPPLLGSQLMMSAQFNIHEECFLAEAGDKWKL